MRLRGPRILFKSERLNQIVAESITESAKSWVDFQLQIRHILLYNGHTYVVLREDFTPKQMGAYSYKHSVKI